MKCSRAPLGVLALLALLAPLLSATAAVAQRAGQRPNIVLIVTDDMDVQSLGAMPNVARLLRDQGTSFANSFVSTPLCCPARASLLRGQYVHNHGVQQIGGPQGGFSTFYRLGLEASTVATWLQTAGYRTAMLGKYQNGYGTTTGLDPTYVPPGWNEWDAAIYGKYFGNKLNENGQLVTYGTAPEDYLTDVLARKATAFVADAAAAGDPFFLYVAPTAPHVPATPAPRHAAAFAGATAPRPPSFDEADVSDKPWWVQRWPRLSAAEIARGDELHRNRLRTLLAVDELVADLVATLRAAGTLDETYVVFTSDNGHTIGQHRLMGMKHAAYAESIAVPLLVRGPGVAAGRVEERLVLNLDLAPTFAELAGAATPGFVDGRSLVPLLSGDPPPSWRQSLLIEYFVGPQGYVTADGARAPALPPTYRALRSPGLLYVEYTTGERELYDLAADPFELDNLAETADPAALDRLSTRLDRHVGCVAAACRTAEDAPFDEDDPLAPRPVILDPATTIRYRVEQPLTLVGSATDAAGQPLPDSALSWEIIAHEFRTSRVLVPPTTGNTIHFTAPTPPNLEAAPNSYLQIRLTATDDAGRSRRVSRVVRPNVVDVTLATDPPGLAVLVNSVPPPNGARTVRSVEGFDFGVGVPSPQSLANRPFAWVGWSDGGAATHTITTPATAVTHTATFRPTEFRFAAEADARVQEAQPTTNFGASTLLAAVDGPRRRVATYLRFGVSGVEGARIERATLRLYVPPTAAAATQDGPGVYAATGPWTETGITWADRPVEHGGPPTDDKGALPAGAWVEFDVTPLVTAEGAHTLVLVSPSTDNVLFFSRETRRPPELVITTAPAAPGA